MTTGTVYLVGAGPGDPGLLSQKGAECLRRAGVVVYDLLVNRRLLDLAPPDAEMIYVGKKAGEHTLEQTGINQLLVDKAKEGKTVVRLKGGDPFVLGRGGEEAESLADNQVPYDIVPGITSAVAVPAYAGIPVTHRGLSSSFAVITGHEADSKTESSINWEKLATAVDTLVILMGMQNLAATIIKLIEHGRSPQTPVAVIQEGTSPQQKTATGTLIDIIDKVTEQGITSPAIVIVGEVVTMRQKIGWFDNRPLFGKRVLVTRARHQASSLCKLLEERGAEPIELPAIDIRPLADTGELDRAIGNLRHYQWLVFTSTNGVEAFFQRLFSLKQDARALHGLKIGAIGLTTAELLETKGVAPDYIPDTQNNRGFVSGLSDWKITGQNFLLPRADIADEELTRGIRELGGEPDDIAAYITVSATNERERVREILVSDTIDVITFTSSSTVSNLMAVFNDEKPAIDNPKIACIGPKTAETAEKAGLRVDIIAGEQTIPGLVAAIEEHFRKEV